MRGVLIINTGSPKSCDKSDVKQFIGDMLSDPLVMSTVPNWFRPILARNIIAPLRGSKSAARYVQIWDKENNQSPLINYSKLLAEKIEKKSEIPVEAVMRYGEPSILSGFQRLIEKCPNLHEVLLVPMFPQYAQSSYQTAVDAVKQCFAENGFTFNLKVAKPFYNHNAFI